MSVCRKEKWVDNNGQEKKETNKKPTAVQSYQNGSSSVRITTKKLFIDGESSTCNNGRTVTYDDDNKRNCTKPNSEIIASGESSAMVIRQPGNQGYFPVDIWQIILRIIGLTNSAEASYRQSESAPHVMLV